MTTKYGWRPDKPDFRDQYRASAPFYKALVLPKTVDLRPGMPPVYDQGELGSCVSNAVGAAMEYNRIKQKLPDFLPSRLFIYYVTRDYEHTINEDAGAEIRDGIKMVGTYGACPETEWPYDIAKFTVKPSPQCYTDAKKDMVKSYARVMQTSVTTIPRNRSCSETRGVPVGP